MKGIVDLYPYNNPPDIYAGDLMTTEKELARFWGRKAVVLGSARVGIYLAVKFFGLNRMDHILVPDFLCQSVLDILNTSSFPVKVPDERTRGVLVFHQWGYPQKMQLVMEQAKKRNLFVLEDCAHSFDSTYQGRKVGSFGDAAVYSFSKIFPTYIGGALVSNNSQLTDYVTHERETRGNLSNWIFNQIATIIAKRSFEQGKSRFWLDAVYLKSIHFPNISNGAIKRFPIDQQQLAEILSRRKANYKTLVAGIKKEYLIPDLEQEIDPNPIYIPVFLPQGKLERARKALEEKSVFVEILHFDVNRNIFQPQYQKCLAVPCQQNLSKHHLDLIIDAINRA